MIGEQHVAFHDLVTLIGWTVSSSQGAKIKLGLPSREALAHFDTATRHRKKRAGQRYHAAIATLDEPPQPLGAMELWFAGANWAHQDGARIVFAVALEDMEFFREHTTRDQDGENAFMFWLTLVQIDDDEKPINQTKVEALDKPKGGPHSKNVAMLLHDDEFQWYVAEKEGLDDKADFAQCDFYVKRITGVKSKVEFDHDPAAWDRFGTFVRSPFLNWAGRA